MLGATSMKLDISGYSSQVSNEMADPLSILASIVTLLGTGRKVAKGIEKILKLKHASDIILALQNEISDVSCVIEDIQSILQRCCQEDIVPPTSLTRAIERTNHTMIAVESLIVYDLTLTDSETSQIRIDKSRWLRKEAKIEELKNQIRFDRVDLAVGLNILISSLGVEAMNQNRQIIIFSNEIQSQVRTIASSLKPESEQSSGKIMQIGTSLEPVPNDRTTNMSENPGFVMESAKIEPYSAIVPQCAPVQEKAPFILQVVSTTNCSLNCGCMCHKDNATRTPRFLNRVLGTLFFGYRAAPWFTQPCNDRLCRAGIKQVSYIYAFPRWFLNRVLQASLVYYNMQGPELILRVMRVREENEIPFSFIGPRISPEQMFSNVKVAIENAEASVLDITPRGWTILNKLAVVYKNYRLVEYLLKKRADPYIESEVGSSPYTEAWNQILSWPGSFVSTKFSELFDKSHLASLEFSRLHQAYLNLSGDSFPIFLSSTLRAHIDIEDGRSRTVLSWAAGRNDQDVVCRLLACGADPNKSDNGGMTPLLWAARNSADSSCISCLIEAKALINVANMIGYTPLMYVVRNDSFENVNILLKSGANINALECDGWSALHLAIIWNTHNALIALLKGRGRNASPGEPDKPLLWHAAWFANVRSLEVLTECAEYLEMNPDRLEECIHEALSCAIKRIKVNKNRGTSYLEDPEKWFNSFQKLAFRIYFLSGDEKSIQEVTGERVRESGLWETNSEEISVIDSDDRDLSVDHAILFDLEDDDNMINASGSDEEWHTAPEE